MLSAGGHSVCVLDFNRIAIMLSTFCLQVLSLGEGRNVQEQFICMTLGGWQRVVLFATSNTLQEGLKCSYLFVASFLGDMQTEQGKTY
jgi:hypothetical protein